MRRPGPRPGHSLKDGSAQGGSSASQVRDSEVRRPTETVKSQPWRVSNDYSLERPPALMEESKHKGTAFLRGLGRRLGTLQKEAHLSSALKWGIKTPGLSVLNNKAPSREAEEGSRRSFPAPRGRGGGGKQLLGQLLTEQTPQNYRKRNKYSSSLPTPHTHPTHPALHLVFICRWLC